MKHGSNSTDMQKPKYQKKNLSQHHFACPKSHIDWYVVLVQKSKGKKPFGRPGYTWEYNIKMDVKQMGWEDAEWI
jgi:hypothetical protein